MRLRLATLSALSTLVVSLSVAGCHRSSVADSDPDQAYRLLSETLGAWKAGMSVVEMREGSPPVYVAEELWRPGFQLVNFSIAQPGERYGPNVLFRVTLEGSGVLRDTEDRDLIRQVQYVVTTTPARTIARYDR